MLTVGISVGRILFITTRGVVTLAPLLNQYAHESE